MNYYHQNGGFIDRFCARHPRFGIPNLMKVIVFGQIAVYLIDMILCLAMGVPVGSGVLLYQLSFAPRMILQEGQLWRLVTWLFLPNGSNPFNLLLGCYFYFWIASVLEREWGTARFSLFYLSGAVLSVLLGLLLGRLQGNFSIPELSYYLNLSIFLILATMFGEMQVLLFFIVPIKMKWMALIDVVLILVEVVQLLQDGLWSLALLPLASFINYFLFTWDFWSYRLGIARRRADPQVVSFRHAQKQAQKKARETGGYRHKCAVCGLTDRDDPNMEFRYCSKCDGYHCYCMNHINSHIHIRED